MNAREAKAELIGNPQGLLKVETDLEQTSLPFGSVGVGHAYARELIVQGVPARGPVDRKGEDGRAFFARSDGCFHGSEAITIPSATERLFIEDVVEALIAFLDWVDGDPDLEEAGDERDTGYCEDE